ncbi:PKD domain-containing protein [Acidobacteria bacterium ACD]|nr:MAG: PKD domain-containing protein [Acidobacteriota bacterium]MDL1949981.1 PKD domain-containing protein [Acidobacteria bacterium ACD]
MFTELSRLALLAALPVALLAGAPSAPAAEPEEGGRPPKVRDLPRLRARHNALLRADAEGRVLSENRLRALEQACEVPLDPSMTPSPAGTFSRSAAGPSVPSTHSFGGTVWQSVGPLPMVSKGGFGNVAGRVTAVTIHPNDPKTVLIGGATGGIWKTTDAGLHWRPVSDSAPALASSDIAYAPSNPSIVYAATGEVDSADLEFGPSTSEGIYLGAGLLKSVDGGDSWVRVDREGQLPTNAILSRVVVHPQDPLRVLVGVYVWHDVAQNKGRVGGLYRSTDGGVTFTKTFAHAVSDLQRDPNNPEGVFAAFGVSNGCSGCPDPAGVYRSTDFGQTFTPSLVSTTTGATFAAQTGNIKLGLTRTSPVTVYASVLDTADTHSGGGIFRSTDAGGSWQKVGVHSAMCPSGGGLNQCSYDHVILPSPTRPEVVYAGTIDLFKSTDAGVTWFRLTDVYGSGSVVHPDQHALAIHPSAPDTVWIGNDGGMQRTTDGGTNFDNLNETLNLAQFNGVALAPADPEFAMGGTQDNGNQRFTGSLVWTDRTGGDGGFNLIRQDDPNYVLNTYYYDYLNYSTNKGETFRFVQPTTALTSDPIAFYPPCVASPTVPTRVFFGTNRVWSNDFFGYQRDKWVARSATPAASNAGRIYALAVAGDGSTVIWAGTTREVLFSQDGGATFKSCNAASGIPNAIVTDIELASADGTAAYVTLGGFTGSLPAKHVWKTVDGGKTFTNISSNLPDTPALSIAVDPSDPAGLFVGTDVGVFRSTNGGVTWTSFSQGLPNAAVNEVKFHPVTGDLWASTYGRGVFRIPASGSPGVPPNADFSFSPEPPAPGQSVRFRDLSAGEPTSWSWDFGDGTAPSTEASPRHAFAQAGTYTVRLTASNAAGSTTKTRSVSVLAGVANPVTLQLPVVLDVFGVAPAHFTSDLVLVNRNPAASRVSLVYTPAPGTPGAGGPRLGEAVGAGRELRFGDVIGTLRDGGYALPESGPAMVGTLRVTFEDVSDPGLVFAGSRTSTPNPNTTVGGSFGLFSASVNAASAATGSVAIYGLREDTAYRSNLAVEDVPPPSGGTPGSAASFSVQVYDGETGAASGPPATFSLGPGEWKQLGSVLGSVKNGYAVVTKTGGNSHGFTAYGVVNDGPSTGGGTSDGSFVVPSSEAADGLVPIVLRVDSSGILYTTELVLANPSSSTATVTLTYVPSARLGGGTGGTTTVSLGPGRQLRREDAITFLRDELKLPLAPGNVNQGGTLRVSGAVALARTFNPNPDAVVGGTFGLSYPALGPSSRAKTEAWVYGLVQNSGTRSNLAVADARKSGGPVTYLVEVFDSAGGDGSAPVRTERLTLSPGQWEQIGKVLEPSGLSSGYVRVRPEAGSSDFVAYGILNDGANPGERTSDGSYVPMTGVR